MRRVFPRERDQGVVLGRRRRLRLLGRLRCRFLAHDGDQITDSGDSHQETKTIRRPACQRTSAVFAFFEFDVERTTCTHARLLRRWVMRHTIMKQWQPMAMDCRTWPGLLGARGSLRLPMERRPSGCRQCSSFVLQPLPCYIDHNYI